MKYRTLTHTAIACLLVTGLTACTTKQNAVEEGTSCYATQIATPFTEADSLEEMLKESGYTLNVPDQIGTSVKCRYTYWNDHSLIAVTYLDGDDQEIAEIRKGSPADDISGIYEQFDATEEAVSEDGITLHMMGFGDTMNEMTWKDGDYAYSLYLNHGADRDTFITLQKDIK